MRRPTSFRDSPESSNARARLRRSSSRSALPFSLGIGVLLLNTYYCILYAEINKTCDSLLSDGDQRLSTHSGADSTTDAVLFAACWGYRHRLPERDHCRDQ